jgi:hypothetical protein
MSYNVKQIDNEAATSNVTGDSINTGELTYRTGNVGIQVIGTGLTSADSTVTFQTSNDATNWTNILDGGSTYTITMASGTSNQYAILTNMAMSFLRPVYTKNTNAGGTISVIINYL